MKALDIKQTIEAGDNPLSPGLKDVKPCILSLHSLRSVEDLEATLEVNLRLRNLIQ